MAFMLYYVTSSSILANHRAGFTSPKNSSYLWVTTRSRMDDNNPIILNTLIRRNEIRFIANKLGEEMVMMDMNNGDFITMNRVGADIWTLSAEPISVKELIQKLLHIYNITEEQCLEETITFLKASRAQNMFIIHDTNNA